MQRLLNRVAIVTGASQGLGRGISLQYHKEGALLVCADLHPEGEGDVSTHELIQQQKGKAIFVKTDVSNGKQVEKLVAKAVKEYGRLDIMVNNAGMCTETSSPKPIDESNEDIFDAHMAVNVKGVYLGCKYALRQMKKQEPLPNSDRGWIVNLASVSALVGMHGLPVYSATKGAVAAMTRAVALDASAHRVHCNAICPGYTQTSLLTAAIGNLLEGDQKAVEKTIPFRGFGRPIDIARVATFYASDDASWVTGTCLAVDGGLTAQ
ncbi:MAG: hypothetical protein M1834_008455 [Cirrosporium novae-zelandiae]|nr:MAG: hypothetical protein M1834_008455 [Cirrosporium novae-zelandiae]